MSNEDTFQILLSTDNHLGFLEKDLIRGNDSFITFEEILSISDNLHPDFMLLGGDLFHENKPSISSLFKTTELLRKYSLNDYPIKFKIISDQSINFSHSELFKHSNFNDDNLNVGMPVFSIHGNHDDPIDQTNLCALDLLHASGLVNLFGKSNSVESIIIQPILLCKGTTKIALYGLGAVRNERLHRLFQQNKIEFLRPTESPDDWFSIFVIHQNRVKHGSTNYIPENFLPDFLDLVFWGHEHDCRLNPEYNTTREFFVSQPGSSVATSLSEGESKPKHVGLLKVVGKDFQISKIALKTVRPLVLGSVILDDEDGLSPTDPKIATKIEHICQKKLEELFTDVDSQLTGDPKQPTLPLVRLSIDYSGGFEMPSAARLSRDYVTRVANPREMLVVHRKREQTNKESMSSTGMMLDVVNVKNDAGLDATRVEDLVRQHFSLHGHQLGVLTEKELGIGVRLSVDKNDKDILDKVVEMQIDRVRSHLTQKNVNEQSIAGEIQRFLAFLESTRDDADRDEEDYIREKLRLGSSQTKNTMVANGMQIDDNWESKKVASKPSKRGAGAGRGRGAKSSRDNSSTSATIDSLPMEDSKESMETDFKSIGDSFRKRKIKKEVGESTKVPRKK